MQVSRSLGIPATWHMPLLFAGAVLLFLLAPVIDLAVSGWFYSPQEGFAAGNATWARLMYDVSPLVLNALTIGAMAAAVAGLWRRFRSLLRPGLFLLAIVVANHVVGGLLLKDNWGRARPIQVTEFGGDKKFTPAWVIAGQCERNCSFISGHASGAFALMALAWVVPRRRRFWLVAGTAWGAHIGLIRIMQGGHFLSDVVFAGFIVYFSAVLLGRWFFQRSEESAA